MTPASGILAPHAAERARHAEPIYVARTTRIGNWGRVEHFPATFIPVPGASSAEEPRAGPTPARSGQPSSIVDHHHGGSIDGRP